MESFILVFTFLLGLSLSQTLQNFDIILTAEERKILISHLDLADLSGVFLTRRQKLAVQEEEYLRSEGYEPFSAKSDGLQIKKSTSKFIDFGAKNSDFLAKDPNASLTFPISKIKPSSNTGLSPFDQGIAPFSTPINSIEGNTIPGLPHLQVFAATPTKTNSNQNPKTNEDPDQFSLTVNFNEQQREVTANSVEPKVNIELLLNKLTKEQQDKFLSQFSQLNFAQQTYAYNQFLSTPPETQQFALNQFLSLDPQVLIVSIQTELNTEPTAGQAQTAPGVPNTPRLPPALAQPQQQFFTQSQTLRNSPLIQVDQSQFQTRFSESEAPSIRSNNVGFSPQSQTNSAFLQGFQERPRTTLAKDPKNIPLTFFPQSSSTGSLLAQPSNIQPQVRIFQTDFVKKQ